MNKWDQRLLSMAEFVAAWSKDTSTKCGAVLANRKRVVSVGFNGFARDVEDEPERYADRDIKYRLVVHAEVNAVLFAHGRTLGCTLYTWPLPPCSPCAAIMIQAGIRRVVAPVPSADILSRWADDLRLARIQFEEAGVELVEVEI